MIVKILGVGCPKCKQLEQKMLDIQEKPGLDYEVQKVTDLNEILEHGVMMTPGLVIDGVLKSAGIIPKDKEILTWLGVE